MNTNTNLLYDLRRQQLQALVENRATIRHNDRVRIDLWATLSGSQYDMRNLSDKALEEIDVLSGHYFDRVR